MKWRSKLLVYPKFQLPLIGYQWGFQTLAFGVVASMIYIHFGHMEAHAFESGLTTAHPYFSYLQDEKWTLLLRVGLSWGVASSATLFFSAAITSKMAGPLVRTLNYLQQFKKSHGRMGPLKFRQGDFMQELPAAVNEAIQSDKSFEKPLKKTGS